VGQISGGGRLSGAGVLPSYKMLYLKRFAIEELSCNAKISLSTATFPYVTCHFDL